MPTARFRLTRAFGKFFESEKTGGLLLIGCSVVSLALANSPLGPGFRSIWETQLLFGHGIGHWVNDALMAIFFLLIGLELQREIKVGELSSVKTSLLPIVAAAGGMAVPALLYVAINRGGDLDGVGIPVATDIAFAIGILALLGDRVPAPLKIFLTALAVIDDLGAVIVIAAFYTTKIDGVYLIAALALTAGLFAAGRIFAITSLIPYAVVGVIVWLLMYHSGVHATIAGVLVGFAVPFARSDADTDADTSPAACLEHLLNVPVAYLILPLFALANTGVVLNFAAGALSFGRNEAGILVGLGVGKPVGITIASLTAVTFGICRLPENVTRRHVVGAAILGGIGFTMSIFITNLAFAGRPESIESSKLAIMTASLCAGVIGCIFLGLQKAGGAPKTDAPETDGSLL